MEPATLARRADHRESTLAREIVPELRVHRLVDTASVGRDDERQALTVVAEWQQKPGRAPDAVVGDVVDQPRDRVRYVLGWGQLRVRTGREDESREHGGD